MALEQLGIASPSSFAYFGVPKHCLGVTKWLHLGLEYGWHSLENAWNMLGIAWNRIGIARNEIEIGLE